MICRDCKENKSTTDFYKSVKRGKIAYTKRCKKCQIKYSSYRKAKIRQEGKEARERTGLITNKENKRKIGSLQNVYSKTCIGAVVR